ncbi:DUF3465 domain-containing protein [Acinetobacter pittii]|jgi:hypothetical protein|uniref:DUF3465 domain-containing protein n=1 Tax=Acinetobacter TaxID=469 RepID=UPI00044D0A10|nr:MULTISPECIES: DUF3465 domain-containing protein [Acinetobacter calcoaceticus/baumannii complex]EXE61544.1 hypothetical protein J580_1947 [Acinetobacter sp. 1542444]MCE6000746.1 DUF3465 domain-containing protein [Acinetobacter pittii]MCE6628864.1 DUF3465 domain-containing protein [Acinetobacter pittii]MDP7844539.1 DUF3465 domain-containing protein [Acinetobacter pittii]MDP7870091.1 DUF3465 domain-containing protein [Acinetobacter pittii]
MTNKKNLSIAGVIILLIAAYFGLDLSGHKQNQSPSSTIPAAQRNETTLSNNGVDTVKAAYEQRQSNVQVQGSGRVKAILRDDNDGSRHQKFILVLKNGLSILVAHNIDLAPKISNLNKGDIVEFYGEYEYNPKGGVLHWTHHDPQGRHESGWLKHDGQIYQ